MRVNEIKLPPQSGKTTMALTLLRGLLADGPLPVVFWVPTEAMKARFLAANPWVPGGCFVVGLLGLAMRTARVVIIDDADKHRNTPEGDLVKLAAQRTQTFHDGVVYAFSTIEEGVNSMRVNSMNYAGHNTAIAGKILQDACHDASVAAGWWQDPQTGQDLKAELQSGSMFGAALAAQKLCLIHSEVSEAMEGHRKGLLDDKLPRRPMMEVELADAVIRIFDLAGAMGYDLGGAIAEKMDYNAKRADHKLENRAAAGGKAY